MVDNMHPLVALAYTTITKTLEAGEEKGHGRDSWRGEPKENHSWKAIRHITTAQGVDVLPEYFPDKETAIQHAEQGLVRAAMYLQILIDEQHSRNNTDK